MAKKKYVAKKMADTPPTYDELVAENAALKAELAELKGETEPAEPIEFPKWLYKYDKVGPNDTLVRTDSVLVQTQEEQDALGPGWVDHYDDDPATPAPVPTPL